MAVVKQTLKDSDFEHVVKVTTTSQINCKYC